MTRTSLSSCASRYPLAMPATTSPLMALRLSGRLMVIQNACPRFSRITLLLSVIVPLACLPCTGEHLRPEAGELQADLSGRCCLLHPDLVVMESRTADRGDCLGAGQHIDTAPADMGLVRLDRFRDQYTAAQAVEQFYGQIGLAPDISECDDVAV